MKLQYFFLLCLILLGHGVQAAPLRISTFSADVTPNLGAPLCGGSVPPAQGVEDPLHARGVVLFPGRQAPIVLCAIDWTGIANASHDHWRQTLAEAAGTLAERVAVHTLHQHDAPSADASTEALLAAQGLGHRIYPVGGAEEALQRTAAAVRDAVKAQRRISHIGMGEAKVEKVASNRRIIGPDGKVQHVRWSAVTDPVVRAFPEGTIDPNVKALSFWEDEACVAVLTWYATHPQSFYRTGMISADFPGMARAARAAALPGVLNVHFCGAAGNVTAGKYNDGLPQNRPVLAGRLETGMRSAFESAKKIRVDGGDVAWNVVPVALPLRKEVEVARELERLQDESLSDGERIQAAYELAWINRANEGNKILVTCLGIGPARLLHLPGELFIEYQLAAQGMAPKNFVCVAAYGQYGAGYIGTAEAYPQGGYETQVYTSRVAPEVEGVLMEAIKQALDPH